MRGSDRVAVNTSVQYLRTIVSIIISLYTSRIVLLNLGVDDYGIYSLIGGIVALLAFIQNNLSRTIQRYLSYFQGRNDPKMLVKIFNNSVFTQGMISLVLCGSLALLTNLVFSYVVNIPEERIDAAKWVYWIMLCCLFVNLQSTPYLAMLISHENIIYSSLVQIMDAIFKIPIAFSIMWISESKLEWYSFMSFIIVVFNFLCYYAYCKNRYEECFCFSIRDFDWKLSREMFSFMGWNVYGTMCIVGRTQGTAILLNRFFGTAINAAFGICGQVSGQLGFLSNALTTAINPQIIKAEGAGDRNKMLRLSEISCKFSFLLMSVVSIPVLFYLPVILELWLKDVPEYTVMLCFFVIISNQIDLITLNLNAANQAIGNVRMYNICVNTLKLLTIPVMYFVLMLSMKPVYAMIVYLLFEIVCAFFRLIFFRINIGLSISKYIQNVFIMIIPPVMVNISICYFIVPYLQGILFLVTSLMSLIVTCSVTYCCSLKEDEKFIVKNMCKKIIRR